MKQLEVIKISATLTKPAEVSAEEPAKTAPLHPIIRLVDVILKDANKSFPPDFYGGIHLDASPQLYAIALFFMRRPTAANVETVSFLAFMAESLPYTTDWSEVYPDEDGFQPGLCPPKWSPKLSKGPGLLSHYLENCKHRDEAFHLVHDFLRLLHDLSS